MAKDDHPHKSRPVERMLVRCTVPECRRWWSIGDADWIDGRQPRCACGGDLEGVDMAAHLASLPVAKPEKPETSAPAEPIPPLPKG